MDSETTHFGFKSIPKSEKESLVGKVFENVADRYDVMNDLMSAGIHRLWKSHFMATLSPQSDTKLLDVAGGTGDIAFRFVEAAREASKTAGEKYDAKVTVLDINREMLRVGQQRAKQLGYDACKCDYICYYVQLLL